ncbi:MAG: hypothetical protein DRG63_00365 [Deltaproteobacteria bacterium]|nr:MAG: hypothetical protein DRG63_00365 [Deltaproteobacteria bacterium]
MTALKPFHFDIHEIQRNKKLFLNYNRLRMEYAYAESPEKASIAFDIIPALLSINEVDLPGYVSKGDMGCGVYGIGSSYRLKNVIQEYFPETRYRNIPYQRYLIRKPIVESLFVLGSIGTVAQTEESDFDFWVCVDESKWSKRTLDVLREKASQISHWCQSTFNMDVHFFVLDLEQIRQNEFGRVDEESSGSSQRNFLKEECYRTMLFVSGKIPFWWVLPPGLGQSLYKLYWQSLAMKAPLDFVDFVDLGYLKEVSKTEFLGNALWQLSKGIKDPFKSLLKMAMMEMYLSDRFKGPLLCDVLKGRVLEGRRFLRELDPYLLMVETVLDFYEKEHNEGAAHLLKKAFYLKAKPMMTRARRGAGGREYKIEVFRDLMKQWNWRLELVEDLNQIENWSYSRLLQFSKEINRFFSSTYRRLSESLPPTEKQAIDEYDLTVLGRKLLALFGRSKNKLQLTPFLTSKRLILDRCVFQYEHRGHGRHQWVLYDTSWYPTERKRKKQRIFSADRVVRAGAWLVNNGLYDFHKTAVEMVPNPTGVTLNDLVHLLKHFQAYFSPAYYFGQNGKAFYQEANIEKIMAIVDMEEISKLSKGLTLDIVFRNTWGELFTEVYPYDEGLNVLIDYVRNLKVKDEKDLASRFMLHLPESAREMEASARIYQEVYQAIGMEESLPGPLFMLHYG